MSENILGDSIRNYRKNNGWSRKYLSKITGIDELTIARQENGQQSIDENNISIYAKAFNTKPSNLFNGNNRYTMNSDKKVTRIVRNRMKELHISNLELAEKIDLPLEKVNESLDENTIFPVNYVHLFSQGLNISMSDLLGVNLQKSREISFGEKLQIVRQYREMSRYELAEAASMEYGEGISAKYIKHVEDTDDKDIDFRLVACLGKILRLNIDYFKDNNAKLMDYLLDEEG